MLGQIAENGGCKDPIREVFFIDLLCGTGNFEEGTFFALAFATQKQRWLLPHIFLGTAERAEMWAFSVFDIKNA